MELFILRHGIAVEKGVKGFLDCERPLTQEGIRQMRLVAKAIKKLKFSFDLIWTSPYTRAKETAEIVAKTLRLMNRLKTSKLLEPDADMRQLIPPLKEKSKTTNCMLIIGHEPFLSQFISMLATGKTKLNLVLKKGGLCRLTLDPSKSMPCASLECLMTPRQLLLLASN